jgi:hypothetical protein
VGRRKGGGLKWGNIRYTRPTPPQAHLKIGERASVKLAIQEYEKLVEMEPDNRDYKDGLKDAMLTWEADWA